MILGGIAVSLVLIMLSKNPKNWRHISLVHDEKQKGSLKTLAESIKMLPMSYEGYSPVRGLMQRIFYEKIKLMKGLSDEDQKKLYRNDTNTLKKYVKDPELIQWLLHQHPHTEMGVFGFFQTERVGGKNQRQMELKKILEKMEKWGT
ncbi:MAG: hypothetical protein NTX92_07440 [Euryarchaeota archaeon]|nr:hypothetical protein [Euryarchaeota archaeon]